MCATIELMSDKDFLWLNVSAEAAARHLLGCEIAREVDGQEIRVKIVETEAYDQVDEASHTFHGRSKRNDAMFRSAGHLYVYFTYGMHHCMNVVCGPEDFGSGVLIRAVEPISGLEIIEKNRGMKGVNTTNGPGKICQALSIDSTMSGHYLSESPIKLIKKPALPYEQITTAKRIGISKAVHELRRFYITDSKFVSKK